MKRIWIVNYYTGSPAKCGNPRYLEFAKNFMSGGYDVTIFNATTTEKIDTTEMFVDRMYDNFHFIHVNTPKYVGNGLSRMKSIWSFAWTLFRNCKKFERPDIVLHNLHTPFDYPILWMTKKLKAKYIAEAWDLWPEVFSRIGLVKESNPMMKIAYALEYHLYKKADQIIFTMEGGVDYLRTHNWTTDKGGSLDLNKIHYVNNGICLSDFDAHAAKYVRDDDEYKDDSIYKIIYMGSIRLANNVKTLIDAAAILKMNSRYRFLIYGDGTDREYLEKYVKQNQIDNVVFKEKHIPLQEVAYVVCQGKVNIMNYTQGFGKYGASSGKMFQYFAAGKPICCNVALNYSEISRRNLGINRAFSSPEEYAEAIRSLAEQPTKEYTEMCARVRKAGEAFDYKLLAQCELEIIES